MPQTIKRWDHCQNIAAVFSDRTNADKAVQAFRDLGVKEQDIVEVVTINDTVRNGRILITVHNVKYPAPIIDIFDENKAEYNPDGSHSIREDVAGLTVGAVAGAALGGAAGAEEGGILGTIVAGLVGTAVGAVVGAVVGGSVGAVAGEIAEHRK
jgi:hypothetical protein